jgi:hypothetical protein
MDTIRGSSAPLAVAINWTCFQILGSQANFPTPMSSPARKYMFHAMFIHKIPLSKAEFESKFEWFKFRWSRRTSSNWTWCVIRLLVPRRQSITLPRSIRMRGWTTIPQHLDFHRGSILFSSPFRLRCDMTPDFRQVIYLLLPLRPMNICGVFHVEISMMYPICPGSGCSRSPESHGEKQRIRTAWLQLCIFGRCLCQNR